MPEVNSRNQDGSMTADSVGYWSNILGNWNTDVSFHANLSGNWSQPTYTWAGSLVGSNQGDFATTTSGFYLGNGDSPMTPASVGLNVEDSDGKTAVGTYLVNFHKPYENVIPDDPSPEGFQDYLTKPSHPVTITTNPVNDTATAGDGIDFTYNFGSPFWATVLNDPPTDEAFQEVAESDVPYLSQICQAVSLTIDAYQTTNGTGHANFDDLWAKQDSLLNDQEVTPSSWPADPSFYRMRPLKLVGHTLNYIHYDSYGADGFDGTKHIVTETFDGRLKTAGNYHYYTIPFD